MTRPPDAARVLSPASMAEADARAIRAGTDPLALMDRAAGAVVRVLRGRYARRPVSVLCGPGQNGGDGWAVAWMLDRAGWDVTLHAMAPPDRLEGAARRAAERWRGAWAPLGELDTSPHRLVVDALFGAGLSRDLSGEALAAVRRLAGAKAPVLAIDLPSGVDGLTGQARGAAPRADATVTFHRRKPGHLLQPGKALCGALHVAGIGLDDEGAPDALRAGPDLFALPRPKAATHKYARGSVVVATGGRLSAGAARLAANAAARTGAGAVTLASPEDALAVNASASTAVMVRRADGADALAGLVAGRASAGVLGPGMGRTGGTRAGVLAVLANGAPCVLDADALTAFEDEPDALFGALHGACVLTPHEGEFARLFGEEARAGEGGKLARAGAAADRAGCTLLLKGPDTVVATPGRVPVICDHGPPWLATAGSGDTLAGVIGALLAQGMGAHEAAAMGAWLHAEAGRLGGPGLMADDLAGLAGRAYAGRLA